ncbi:MAG: hypothetical protein IT382_19430 [Deltaproteobacteria bacterium]|nr:hypothetical protein [Deltaproteobacteria bacterium]
MVGSVRDTSVNATRQSEQATLQVDLASFVALPVAQKQLYLAALEGDPPLRRGPAPPSGRSRG